MRSAAGSAARIPTLNKLGYGVGNLAYSIPYQATASYLIFFSTAILKIPATLAGAAVFLSLAWDAVTDPLIGYLSDNTESRRFGRRHGYILIGGLTTAALTFVLWSIGTTGSVWTRFALLLLVVLLLRTTLTVIYIPYLALGGELSTDYDERSSIQGVRAAFYLAGMLVALAGVPMIFFRATAEFPRGQLNPDVYPRMGMVLGLLAALATVVTFFATKKSIQHLPNRTAEMKRRGLSAFNLWSDFAAALRNRDLLMLVIMIFLIEFGFQLGIGIGIHVNTYTYKLSGPMIGLLALVILGTSVISQPFWVWFTRRFEKRTALMAGLLIGAAGFIGAPWVHVWWKLFPLDVRTLPLTLSIFMVAAGLGNGAFMSIPNSMVADTADVEEARSGKRDEGLFFGIYTFAYKFGVGLSLLASGVVLDAVGFDPHASVQSAATEFNLAMVPTYFLLFFCPLTILCIVNYRITRSRWRAIQQQLGRT
jgi:glycoside/pentoside/hexuronide:cation symporter, GPH family